MSRNDALLDASDYILTCAQLAGAIDERHVFCYMLTVSPRTGECATYKEKDVYRAASLVRSIRR